MHPDLGSSVTFVADDPRPSKEGQSPSRKQSNKVAILEVEWWMNNVRSVAKYPMKKD